MRYIFYNKQLMSIWAFVLMALFGFEHNSKAQCSNVVFEDEFNGSTVDASKWSFDIGDGCPELCGWGNAEEQYYRSENASIQNGRLIITTQNQNFGGKPYTSAKLTTSGKYNMRYGRVEASIKLPSAGGIWPAFWLLPENGNWPYTGEIDIMEAAHSNPTEVGGTVHYNNGGHQFNGRAYEAGLDLSAGFHEYAIEWEPTEIRWYVDDQLYHTVTPQNTVDPWPFDEGDWYIILNVAVGGLGTPYTGFMAPSPADYPTQMEVEYVRVLDGTYNIQLTGDNSVYENETNKVYSITATSGATYNWSVPAGASITSGQGTPSITVDWGTTEGDVAVVVNVPNCGTSNYDLAVSVNPPRTVDTIFEDFESNRQLSYNGTGTLNQSASNPGPDAVNNSSTVGLYQRNPNEQYDVLAMQTSAIGNALAFTSGEKTIQMDVYTNAPVGTEYMLQLENSATSGDEYPAGRHSRYTATTTTSNQWETLEFILLDRPDATVSALDVDQFALLVDANSNTNHSTYFDNIVSMQAPPPTLLDEVMLMDYQSVYELDTIFSDGAYVANVTNPSANAVNNSSQAASYTRNADSPYDVISFGTDAIENAGPFKEGDNLFFMDLYTDAPVGTEITLSLENQSISENDFPAGRNSQYTGFVAEQNNWHTVAFTHAASPDGATSNLQVDEISLLFNPNSNTNNTYYIDNFRYGVTELPPTYSFDATIQNYNGTDNLSFDSNTTGTYSAPVANPAPNGVNGSSQAAQYVRNNTEDYDVLFFNTNSIADASAYADEEKRFAMDVYTSAPAGTVISWQLEASGIATDENYPNGRHSIYQASVKEQNAWHTIEFVLTSTPDLLVSDADVDRVVFLMNPGNSSGDTYYIDNLRSLSKDGNQTPVLSQISVSPANPTIQTGQTQAFSAQGLDQFGNPISTSITWSSSGGTINQAGEFFSTTEGTYTITATSGNISGTASITVESTPSNAIAIPAIIQAEDYNDGGNGTGYYDITAGNTGGAYRQDDVDIEATNDTGGGYNVGWIDANEWLAFDIDATASSNLYDIDFRVASPSGGSTFHLEIDGTDVTGSIAAPATGSWQSFQTVTAEDVSISTGSHELRIVFESSGMNLNYIEAIATTGSNPPGGNCTEDGPNGDYTVAFDGDPTDPTITFIPGENGVGNPTAILYYSTDANATFPGYGITPNTPFSLSNVSDGETVYFYFTYSVPEGGERNSAASPHAFTVGQCVGGSSSRVLSNSDELKNALLLYPNPADNFVNVQYVGNEKLERYEVIDLVGKVQQVGKFKDNGQLRINTNNLKAGTYLIKVSTVEGNTTIKRFLRK